MALTTAAAAPAVDIILAAADPAITDIIYPSSDIRMSTIWQNKYSKRIVKRVKKTSLAINMSTLGWGCVREVVP